MTALAGTDDTEHEGTETLRVLMSTPVGATLTARAVDATISDDDAVATPAPAAPAG